MKSRIGSSCGAPHKTCRDCLQQGCLMVFVFIDRVKIDVPCAGVDRMKTTSSYWPALDFCQGLTQHTFLPWKPLKRPVSALTFRSRGFLESARNAIPSNPTYKHDVKTTGDMKTTARSDQFPSFQSKAQLTSKTAMAFFSSALRLGLWKQSIAGMPMGRVWTL